MKKRVKKSVKSVKVKTSSLVSKSDFSGQIKHETDENTNKLLLENFISLQEALVGLGSDLKDLNHKMTSLLELFENAARKFEEKPEARSMASKLNSIMEQNQTIAKTLLLLSKKIKDVQEPSKAVFPGLEGFKPSIKQKEEEQEDDAETEEKEGSKEETKTEDDSDKSDDSDSGDEDSDEFKPEPLPDFNF